MKSVILFFISLAFFSFQLSASNPSNKKKRKANGLYYKGIIFLKENKFEKALKVFEKAFQTDPTNDEIKLALTKIYITNGSTHKAAKMCENINGVDNKKPHDKASFCYQMALIFSDGTLYSEATILLENAAKEELKSDKPDFQLLSKIYNAIGYNKAINGGYNTKPGQQMHLHIYPLQLRRGIVAFCEALRYNPSNQDALLNLKISTETLHEEAPLIVPFDSTTFFKNNIKSRPDSIRVDSSLLSYCNECLKIDLLPKNHQKIVDELNKHEEVVLVLDISGSMRVPLEGTNGSRFDVMKNLATFILMRLDKQVKVGIVTVGGLCQENPIIRKNTFSDRKELIDLVNNLRMDGETPLSSVLLGIPEMFKEKDNVNKAVFLLSDGLNSCEPAKDACEIAQYLDDKYIHLHILSFLLESPEYSKEYGTYECMTRITSGKLIGVTTDGAIEEKISKITETISMVLPEIESHAQDGCIYAPSVLKINLDTKGKPIKPLALVHN